MPTITSGGCVVLEQDRLFFVATLSESSKFRRDIVYQADPGGAVHAIVGPDGAHYPPGIELQPSAGSADLYDPAMAGPGSAQDMRRLAGIETEEDRQRAAEEPRRGPR